MSRGECRSKEVQFRVKRERGHRLLIALCLGLRLLPNLPVGLEANRHSQRAHALPLVSEEGEKLLYSKTKKLRYVFNTITD